GCIPPGKTFLETLRSICTREGIVYIFDEVMTGFRLAPGGAQERLNIDADLVTFGKVIGAGLPVGAFGGKKEIMQHIAPLGNVYQAGTLSGNPIAMAAGFTLLGILNNNRNIYQSLEYKTQKLKEGLEKILRSKGVPFRINQLGSMISLHFSENDVVDFATAASANNAIFNKFFHAMLKRGVYLAPSAFETWFVSDALNEADIEQTVEAADKALDEII
ncbi:MAG: aminotransferase class III-fold pyridoxal phosphate-dependent enzyme, partial [Chitinophagaceae bacterium]